jgi:hypothetical protein
MFIYGKLAGLSNKFEPSMVFDPSEFEGPRFDLYLLLKTSWAKNKTEKVLNLWFIIYTVPRVKYFTLKFWTLFKVLNIEFCVEYWIVCWILNCVDYWTLILNYLPRVVCFCWNCDNSHKNRYFFNKFIYSFRWIDAIIAENILGKK